MGPGLLSLCTKLMLHVERLLCIISDRLGSPSFLTAFGQPPRVLGCTTCAVQRSTAAAEPCATGGAGCSK